MATEYVRMHSPALGRDIVVQAGQVAVLEKTGHTLVEGEGPITDPTRPTDSAHKPVWVAHAESKGATREAANAMTKAELIKQYG